MRSSRSSNRKTNSRTRRRHKTMNKTLLSILVFLKLSCCALAWGQAIPVETTLVNAVTEKATVFQLTSGAGISPASANFLFIDRELMPVTAISGARVTVTRGLAHTPITGHAAGATVYAGPAAMFTTVDPSGACTAPSTAMVINTNSGNSSACTSGSWVLTVYGAASGGGGSTGNATSIQSTAVSSTAPTDAQVLEYSSANAQYQPVAPWEDSRPMQVSALKPNGTATNYPAGGTITLLSASGAGNVDMIQVAINDASQSSYPQGLNMGPNSIITICTNGEASPCQQSDLGTFFGWHAEPAQPFSSSDTLMVTEYAWTAGSGTQYCNGCFSVGGFRRIFIPYTNGITITITSASSDAGRVFSQVYYHTGSVPPQLTGSRRKVFHIAQAGTPTSPFQAVSAFATQTLASISGRGEIESISQVMFQGSATSPIWLEGAECWTIDGGTSQCAMGTEDFFGGQYYWGQVLNATDSWGALKNSCFSTSCAAYATTAYRYFANKPANNMTFNSSWSINWTNGHVNEPSTGSNPGTTNVSATVVYWLDH
jgi:hypothetical protein